MRGCAGCEPEGLEKNIERDIQGVGGNKPEFLGSSPLFFELRDIQGQYHTFLTDRAEFVRSNINELILTCQWLQKHKVVVVMETRHFYVPECKAWFSLRGQANWKLVKGAELRRGKVKIPTEVLSVARSHGKSQLEYLSECELDGWQSNAELERVLKDAGIVKIKEFKKWHSAAKLANEELERLKKIEENEQTKNKMIEDHWRDVAKSLSCDRHEVDGESRSPDELLKALKEGSADKKTVKRAMEHSNFLRKGILLKFERTRMKAVTRALRKRIPLELLQKLNPEAWKHAQEETYACAGAQVVDAEQLKKLNGGVDVVPVDIHDKENELYDPECNWSVKGVYNATILEDLRTEGKSRQNELVYTQEAQDVETPEDIAEERDDRRARNGDYSRTRCEMQGRSGLHQHRRRKTC